MKDKIIISICGAAGTGKSALANEMAIALGKDLACRIPTDYFLKSYIGVPYEEFISTSFKYDWNLLKEVLSSPIGREYETPEYDFSKFIRTGKTGGRLFSLKRYIFVDSMLPYPDSDFIIKLEARESYRLERIKKRDTSQGVNSVKNWRKMEITAKLLDEGNYKFDLILDGKLKTRENAKRIVGFLKDQGLLS
jgi:uridine kinase